MPLQITRRWGDSEEKALLSRLCGPSPSIPLAGPSCTTKGEVSSYFVVRFPGSFLYNYQIKFREGRRKRYSVWRSFDDDCGDCGERVAVSSPGAENVYPPARGILFVHVFFRGPGH